MSIPALDELPGIELSAVYQEPVRVLGYTGGMRTPILVLGSIILGVLTVIAACVLLAVAWGANAWLTGAFSAWKLDSLPQGARAERFLPYWDDFIYVQSRNGGFYAQPINPRLTGGWREVNSSMVGELGGQGYGECGEISQPWTPASPAPGQVVQGLECGYWTQNGSFFKYSYALMDNGAIWRWRSP